MYLGISSALDKHLVPFPEVRFSLLGLLPVSKITERDVWSVGLKPLFEPKGFLARLALLQRQYRRALPLCGCTT